MDDRKALLSPKGGVMRTFGILGLDQVTKAMLMEWWTVEMEGRGRARSTVGNHLNAVSGVLAYAVDLDLIESNPVDVFRGVLRRRRRTKQGRAEAERLDRRNPIESVDRLGAFVRASAAVGADYHLATMLMLDAGLRIGEVEALTWGHVQAGSSPSDPSRSILVTVSRARGRYEGSTKSGRSRRVALSQRLRGLLLERRMERGRPDDSELIFDDFSRKLYRRHFDCVCSAADLEGHTPKDLRDSFASHLLTVGIARSYVALQLGHEDEKTTGRHYAKWIEGDQYRESMALLEGEVPADLIARVVEESHNDSHNGTAGNAAS
jgi:integrase